MSFLYIVIFFSLLLPLFFMPSAEARIPVKDEAQNRLKEIHRRR